MKHSILKISAFVVLFFTAMLAQAQYFDAVLTNNLAGNSITIRIEDNTSTVLSTTTVPAGTTTNLTCVLGTPANIHVTINGTLCASWFPFFTSPPSISFGPGVCSGYFCTTTSTAGTALPFPCGAGVGTTQTVTVN